jgi:hypothetical protein
MMREVRVHLKIGLKSAVLMAVFASTMVVGRNEYFIILERFVKLICTSCIGI